MSRSQYLILVCLLGFITALPPYSVDLSLAAMPPHAFGLVKRHLAMAPLSLESTLEMEAMAQSLGFSGPEFAEGRAAFADKRKPNFR